jgi:hypothetical protein
MELIAENFTTVGELIDALKKLPADTNITPFGDQDAALIYDKEGKTAYLDNMTYFEEKEMLPERDDET